MSIQMSEGELRTLGLQLDPGDPTRAIRVAPQADFVPDDSWDLDRLGFYSGTRLNEAKRLHGEMIQLGRRSTVQIFRAGHALSIARQKVKWGQWDRWLKEHNIKRTTAWEAIQLYERAGSEEAIRNLTWAQAKRRYGITKSPPVDTRESAEHGDKSNPSSDTASHSDDQSGDDDSEDDELDDDEAGLETPDEPDVPARPPKSVRDMLIASSNLLLSCLERPHKMDAACGDILDEIEASVKELRAKVVQ